MGQNTTIKINDYKANAGVLKPKTIPTPPPPMRGSHSCTIIREVNGLPSEGGRGGSLSSSFRVLGGFVFKTPS